MTDIQLHRARIGTFTNICGVQLERSKGNKGCPSHSKGGIKIITLMTILALVCIIILSSFDEELLEIGGGVELNPGLC